MEISRTSREKWGNTAGEVETIKIKIGKLGKSNLKQNIAYKHIFAYFIIFDSFLITIQLKTEKSHLFS